MKDATYAKAEHAWYCRCSVRLAWFDLAGFHLHPELTRLDGEEDGLARYGRAQLLRSRFGRGPKANPSDPPRRGVPIFVYCPVCHAGQRVAS